MPPPTIAEILEVETGRGLRMREKPGVASKSSAVVVLGDIQVSVRAKRSIL
jgi:hypothetical protein